MPSSFLNAEVEQYLYSLLPSRDSVLLEMEALAGEKHIPIVGPAVGRLLALLAASIGARRVFEMGSAIGYSTIWLARAVGPDGAVYYTDGSPENAAAAERFLTRAGVADRVSVLVGDALELLDAVGGDFDFIFNDIDKRDYPIAFAKAVPRVRRGGFFVADNALWSGKVAAPAPGDADTAGIVEFNRLIYATPELLSTIVPLRDGVAVCLKL